MFVLSSEKSKFIVDNWRLDAEPVFFRKAANTIYFATRNGTKVVVRIAPVNNRPVTDVEAELDWMRYLSESGIQTAVAIVGANGTFASCLEGGEVCCVFSYVAGLSIWKSKIWDENIARAWGRSLGKMHKLNKKYLPAGQHRQQWDGDVTLQIALRSVDFSFRGQKLLQLIAKLESLPKIDYGLVHADLHEGNFFIHDNELNIFDFDDCCYHWYAYDVAVALISLDSVCKQYNSSDMQFVFMDEYEKHTDKLSPESIVLFQQYRNVMMYHWIQTSLRESRFDDAGMEWAAVELATMRDDQTI